MSRWIALSCLPARSSFGISLKWSGRIGRSAKRHFLSFPSYSSGGARPTRWPTAHVTMWSSPSRWVLSFDCLNDPGSVEARSRATEGFSATTRVFDIRDQGTHIDSHTPTGWWLEEAGGAAPRAPLEGAHDADVVVIGGGYTGMWTAWHLLDSEPGIRVLLLEGGICGHGPSGRNGGFCESLWFSAPALRERFGDEPARALLDASSETVAAIGAWCRDNDVDAWFDQSGYLCVSTGPAFDDVGFDAVEAASALGAPDAVRNLSEAEVRERVDSPVFGRGVLVPDFATVQPARLALGLRDRLIERGAALFECSRVRGLRVEPGGHSVVAETAGGQVRAGAAVLAMGPAARSVRPLRSRLSVTSSHIVLTEPVPDVLDEIGWRGRVHHRRPDAPPLLPHHARRPDRVRLGRRAAGIRRPPKRADRGGPGRGGRGAPAPRPDLPRPRGPRRHARLGRADRRLAQPHRPGRHAGRRPGSLRARV